MKTFFALVGLCLISQSYGQTITSDDATPNLLNFVASSYELLETYEVKEAENDVDITTDYWDTSKIRVDYGKDIKFPIHLQFNDSNYASPISKNKVITSRYGWRKMFS